MRFHSLAAAAGILSLCVSAPGAAQIESVSVKSITVRAADSAAWNRIAAAENARAATPEQLRIILDGARSASRNVRAFSVRALGRLQRPELTDSIARLLHDPSAIVRMHAGHAIALANFANRNPDAARDTILRVLATERNDTVVGALAETLGRLRNTNVVVARATAGRLAALSGKGRQTELGIVRGLHFIARSPVRAALDTARPVLIRMAITDPDVHTRRLAVTTLAVAGQARTDLFATIIKDTDPIVRRESMLFANPLQRDSAEAFSVIVRGLLDESWAVRFEAVRQMGARIGASGPCDMLVPYATDRNMHVRLEAIDLIGRRCAISPRVVAFLDSTAASLPAARDGAWHAAAHALTSLAMRDAERARTHLMTFARHPNLFVRTYGTLAATTTRDTALLRGLARDPQPNVRTVAVQGLSRIVGHAADSIYIAQLSLDDSQLLMAAVAALDSTTRGGTAELILDALDRVSLKKIENSRDGRIALLSAASRLGTASLAARVTPYLRDFDPAVASLAASVIGEWTGTKPDPAPQPLADEPMPSFAELTALASSDIRVVMEDGKAFIVRLLPFDAPTNAARFARLAGTHWFDGLTLHRVEPNFVVQGGSPNANEYAGAPRFSRDEVGYPNNRGTIGLSTRGHDTGDAQIFFNVIDNAWLDAQYTVFAYVVSGMDVVDGILEGAVIRSMTVRPVTTPGR